MMRSLMIGVDVGGTFTDVLVLDEATGKTRLAKVPTSRPDQSGGFLAGIAAQVADFGRIASVVHGTTAGTNALLEPRDLRPEVAERTLADGTVLTAVNSAEVEQAARALLGAGCQAVAVLLVPGLGGLPITAAHLLRLRPFLARGDFAPGSWGNSLVDALQTLDFVVEKVNYSVFYQSRMDWVVKAPVIIDADTGFGNALNARRTMTVYDRAGANALQVEDQGYPKRCGHLADKSLIPAGEMAGKIAAMADTRNSRDTLIIARTDAIALEGFQAAVDRAGACLEAGADAADLETLGFSLVIFPGGIVRALASAAEAYCAQPARHGVEHRVQRPDA